MTSADPFVEDSQLIDLAHFVEGEQVDAMTSSQLSQWGVLSKNENATLARRGHIIKYKTGPFVRPCKGSNVVTGVLDVDPKN